MANPQTADDLTKDSTTEIKLLERISQRLSAFEKSERASDLASLRTDEEKRAYYFLVDENHQNILEVIKDHYLAYLQSDTQHDLSVQEHVLKNGLQSIIGGPKVSYFLPKRFPDIANDQDAKERIFIAVARTYVEAMNLYLNFLVGSKYKPLNQDEVDSIIFEAIYIKPPKVFTISQIDTLEDLDLETLYEVHKGQVASFDYSQIENHFSRILNRIDHILKINNVKNVAEIKIYLIQKLYRLFIQKYDLGPQNRVQFKQLFSFAESEIKRLQSEEKKGAD